SEREGLAEEIHATADLLQRPGDDRRGAGPGDRQPAAPFAVEPVAAHKDVAGHADLDVERRRKRRWLVRGGGCRLLPGLAVDLDHLQHDQVGRQALRKIYIGTIDG